MPKPLLMPLSPCLGAYGLPTMLTLDRDVRWVGSATQRDFPSALLQFLYCVGVHPNILPPHHPELNCYVERYNKSYKQGCILVYRPTTVEEVRTVTEHFQQHYNLERPRSVTQLSQSPTGCGSSRLADPSHLTRECRS